MSVAKVIVIGGAGMLGHKIFQTLRERVDGVHCTIREDVSKAPLDCVELLHGNDVIQGVDVTDFLALEAVLSAFRPEFVVNCVGVIKQRAEAVSAVPSITINSLLPHRLAQMAAGWGGRVTSAQIAYLTVCVGGTSKETSLTPRTSTGSPSFWARWQLPMRSPCGLRSLAGNSQNTARC